MHFCCIEFIAFPPKNKDKQQQQQQQQQQHCLSLFALNSNATEIWRLCWKVRRLTSSKKTPCLKWCHSIVDDEYKLPKAVFELIINALLYPRWSMSWHIPAVYRASFCRKIIHQEANPINSYIYQPHSHI